jgi:hypothetical protein
MNVEMGSAAFASIKPTNAESGAIALSASRAERAFASAAFTLFTTPAPALLGHDHLPATCP